MQRLKSSITACMSLPHVWILVGLTLLGLLLRLINLDVKGFWSDELCTIASALGNSLDPDAWKLMGKTFDPIPGVDGPWLIAADYDTRMITSRGLGNWAATAHVLQWNVHPPLFFWLSNVVIHALGISEASLRLLPVLFGTACIPAIFFLGRRLACNGYGLLAAAMMSLSGYQIAHAQDARAYSLLILLSLLAMMVVWYGWCKPRPNTAWYGFALGMIGLLGIYTQYLFIAFLAVAYVTAVWLSRKHPKHLVGLIITALTIGIGLIPWLPTMLRQKEFLAAAGHYTRGLWPPIQLPEKLWRILTEFLIPGQSFPRIALLLLVLVIIGAMVWAWKKEAYRPAIRAWLTQPGILIPLVWVTGLILGQLTIDLVNHTHTATIRRYLILGSPALYLLIAGILTRMPAFFSIKPWFRTTKYAMMAGLLVWMAFGAASVLSGKTLHSDDFKLAAAWIQPQLQSSDIVLVHKSGAITVGMAHYLPGTIRMSGIRDMHREELARRLGRIPDDANRVWLVLSHNNPNAERLITEGLRRHRFQPTDIHKVPGITIRRLDRHPTLHLPGA